MISYKRWRNPKYLCADSDWLQKFIGNRMHFWAATGRGSLDYLINRLMPVTPDGVILPAFVAEGVILPFQKNKIPIYFYKLNKDLSPSIDSLEDLIRQHPNVSMMVAIHFFGIEIANLDVLCRFAMEHHLILIEDCAQALGSKGRDGSFLGRKGDVSLFSFPKSIPVPFGSLLIINQSSKLDIHASFIQYHESILSKLALLSHRLYIALQGVMLPKKSRLVKLMRFASTTLYYLYYKSICNMNNPVPVDTQSMDTIMKFNYPEMIKQRLKNTCFIREALPNCVESEYLQYDGAVMTGYPIMVENRDIIRRKLRKRGIETLAYTRSWNYVPKDGNRSFLNETNILSHHLLLPISENYDLEDIKIVVNCLKEVAHESSN